MSSRLSIPLSLLLPLALSGCLVDSAEADLEPLDTDELANVISIGKSPAPVPPNLVGDWTGEIDLRVPWETVMTVDSQSGRYASGTIELPASWFLPEVGDEVVIFDITLHAAASGTLSGVGQVVTGPGGEEWAGTYWPTLQVNGTWDGPTSSPDFEGDLHVETGLRRNGGSSLRERGPVGLRRNGPASVRANNPTGLRVPTTNLIYPIAMEKG